MRLSDKDRPLQYDYPRDKWEHYCMLVTAYKDRLSAEFTRWTTGKGKVMEYEKFIASLDDGREAIFTTKYDGELNLGICEPFGDNSHFVAFFNQLGEGRAGKFRTDIEPLCGETEALLKAKGIARIVVVGELYALSKDGKTLPRGQTASIILKPGPREAQIHFAVFDILELNDKRVEDDYWKKCLLLQDIFGEGKHIHPVFAKKGGKSVAMEMWKNKVLDEGYEGFVVHSDGTIKVKLLPSYDLAVIGIVQTDTYKDTGAAKTLALAWMDEEGHYRYCCNCGNGLSFAEQRALAKELVPTIVHKDYKLGKYLIDLVKPTLVVQIKCVEVLPERRSEAWKWTGADYEYVGEKVTAALREPRFFEGGEKYRRDKSATNWLHCRIDQIPDWGEPEAPKPVFVKAVDEIKGPVKESSVVEKTVLKDVEVEEDEEDDDGGEKIYCIRPLW